MAEPVLDDEDPLSEYLRGAYHPHLYLPSHLYQPRLESGDAPPTMPGSSFLFQSDLERPISFPHFHSLRTLLNKHLPFFSPNPNSHKPTPLAPQKVPTPTLRNPFAERFKYDIISSSLLSSSLLPFTSHSHPLYSPSASRNRSRPSTPARGRGLSIPGSLDTPRTPETETEEDYRFLSIASALSVILLSAGYYISAVLCLTFVFYSLRAAAVVDQGINVSKKDKDTRKWKVNVMVPVSTPPPARLVVNQS